MFHYFAFTIKFASKVLYVLWFSLNLKMQKKKIEQKQSLFNVAEAWYKCHKPCQEKKSVLHKLIRDMSREDYEEREAPLCQTILQT